MKKAALAVAGIVIFSGCASKQEQQTKFKEYNPLMEVYEEVFYDEKTENVFKGGLLGGSGKTLTVTFPEIVSIAVKEAAAQNKKIQYNCVKCKDNYLKIIAIPEEWNNNCGIVKVKYMRREDTLKEESFRVCKRIGYKK
ncbi:MAG TPA: hypothetical protein DEP48_06500 [Persephonella sp.]|uniref:Putative lipoprotein n=1 Tax=Persephonella marina (strain DSM 14350 / EX-H1) TaxID=123214 RepID=C0QUM5_PERMH|nr:MULTISPECIES: hypothetical protein [Persephonella]ACO03625.1 putative lipoprotein [Persephonella marina EX-H1]HCB69993.1 hypothetical protein [Persephonella sp.]